MTPATSTARARAVAADFSVDLLPVAAWGGAVWSGTAPGVAHDQAASLPAASLLNGLMVEGLAATLAGSARTSAVLLAKVITAWAAASDI
jgi:hypothetical protein